MIFHVSELQWLHIDETHSSLTFSGAVKIDSSPYSQKSPTLLSHVRILPFFVSKEWSPTFLAPGTDFVDRVSKPIYKQLCQLCGARQLDN